MVAFDEDALICDFAETYHIYDYRSLPVELVATYAVGLRDDSRIKIKMSGMKISFDKYLIAGLFDKVNWLCWTKTKDATHNSNMPTRILDLLLDLNAKSNNDDLMSYDSPDAFEEARRQLLGEE